MKFKVDENLPTECARRLREAGHDAMTILEQEMGGEKDPEVARVVQEERRVLVTLDVGFGDILRYPPSAYYGLIVLRLKRQDKASVLLVVDRLLERFAQRESIAGELWIVDEEKVRIWSR